MTRLQMAARMLAWGLRRPEGASPWLCLGFLLCGMRQGPVCEIVMWDVLHEQMPWFVQKTLWTSFQRWVVVNTGYFDDEKYSFFEALAEGTAIVWCSYKYHMYSNIFLSKMIFVKLCFYATCDNKCYLYFRVKTGLVYVLNINNWLHITCSSVCEYV